MLDQQLAQSLMENFAEATGIEKGRVARRYLWTDAFAVCNFLALWRRTKSPRYLALAKRLVDQVHHVLGRHRDDDSRKGWISGLSEIEGERHPTRSGLRIGKTLPERPNDAPFDERREWDRDGQYFHYLTKWIHALRCMSDETNEPNYHRWTIELAKAAYKGFAHAAYSGGPKRLVWKMSIDLSRPLIASTGQHDPLDGLITCLEIQHANRPFVVEEQVLDKEIAELLKMCGQGRWVSDDPLGIGGLLESVFRLAHLVVEHRVNLLGLLERLMIDAEASLQTVQVSSFLNIPAERRLAFRELGMAIGIKSLRCLEPMIADDAPLAHRCRRLTAHLNLGEQIEAYWTNEDHRRNPTWNDHLDINAIMLTTCLVPEGYLRV